MTSKYPFYLLIFCFSALVVLPSCNTFIGKFYDNTTARYNSYYLAKEKMKEVDIALKAYSKDDYHRILNIHYPSDSNFGKSNNAALEDVFKYASWSVRWHKRSKWADNNYILIGRVRHYQANYKDGLETFKYVNSTSKTPKDKHEALICLMRLFTDFNEWDNVGYVIDFMDKEQNLTRKNKREYLVAKAAYYQHFEDYKKVHSLLDTAVSLSRRKHDKAKLSFINGQVSEYLKSESGETKTMLDFDADKEAYKNYTTTIRANPKYELWFNARLNRMRVSPASDLKDVDKARKYYKKMLADQKNKEYKDRIYYEYASFERKVKEYPKAESNYKKSVQNATSNQKQKAYSYLALGEMYYEDQQRFEDAKLYYDSAIAILPHDHKGYGKIYRRQRILKDFVEHLNIVKREDSLQRLATMDSSNLNRFLESYIEKEEKRMNEEAKRLAKEARKNAAANNQSPFNTEFTPSGQPVQPGGTNSPAGFSAGLNQSPVFYFYNQSLAAQGKIEFQQKWGRRKLEDNWRISTRDSDPDEVVQQVQGGDTASAKKSSGAAGSTQNKSNQEPEEEEELIKIDKAELVASIPLTEEKMKASHAKIQPSLYKLGKIYSQHLNEPENAVKSLQRLIKNYPDNENVPEAHYIIYLISKGKDTVRMEEHKQTLLQKYPHTIYAKMIANPNYLAESKLLNKQIMARYKAAYEVYQRKQYHEADSLFTLIQTDYPDSEFDPKIDLIKAIMKGRAGQKEEYRTELQAYVNNYKSGSYHDYAQQLIDKYDGKTPKPKEEPADSTVNKAPAMPDKFIPGQSPDEELPEDMPENMRKMYEQRRQDRGNQNQPGIDEQQVPVPADQEQAPAIPGQSNQPAANPRPNVPSTPENSMVPPETKPGNTAPDPAQNLNVNPAVPGSTPAFPNGPGNQETLPPSSPPPVIPGNNPADLTVPPANPVPSTPAPGVPAPTTPAPAQNGTGTQPLQNTPDQQQNLENRKGF